jgi:hypothetical protein
MRIVTGVLAIWLAGAALGQDAKPKLEPRGRICIGDTAQCVTAKTERGAVRPRRR